MIPEKVLTTTGFLCPFCGRQAGASSNPPAVVHALPMCEQFRELEPADYLAAVNKALAVVS